MHPSIISALTRLRQDVAEILTPQTLRDGCHRAGYSWRNRTLDPVATIAPFVLQILHGNTACQQAVQLEQWAIWSPCSISPPACCGDHASGLASLPAR